MSELITQENIICDLPDLNRFKVGDSVLVTCYDFVNEPAVIIGLELRRQWPHTGKLEPCITLLHNGDQISDGFKPSELTPSHREASHDQR